MEPTTTAALISAGGSLAGGLLGGQSSDVDYRGAKKGIRWRVRDAKAAGIHPLYAMGAPGVGQGQVVTGQSNTGSAVSDAANAIAGGVRSQSSTARAQLRATNAAAERDEAQAAYWRSEARRSSQKANSQQDLPHVLESTPQTGKLPKGLGKLQTSDTVTQQEIEDQYGGVIGEAYGLYRAAHDYRNRPNRGMPRVRRATDYKPTRRGIRRRTPRQTTGTYTPRGRGYSRRF